MPEEKRSPRAYEIAGESEQKFDYFMAGLSTAILSYLAPKLEPARLGLNAASVELIAMLAFTVAVLASLKRIEATVRLRQAQASWLEASEFAGELQDSLRGKSQVVSVRSNEVIPAEKVRRDQAAFVMRVEEQVEEEKKTERRMRQWATARLAGLILGFLLLLTATVWKGYL